MAKKTATGSATAKPVARPAAAPAKGPARPAVSARLAAAAARRGDDTHVARPVAGPQKLGGPVQADTAPTPARATGVASSAPPAKAARLKVQARKMGYYGHERRRVGDVFLVERSQFNPSWMVPVDSSTKLQRTTGKEELRKKHDEILQMKNADRVTTAEHDIEDTGDNPLDAD